MSQPAPLYDKPRVAEDGSVEFPESWKKYFQVLDALVKAMESSVDTLEDPTTAVNVHTHADSTEGGPLYFRHYSVSADTTLAEEHNGGVVEISGTFTLTLPALADVEDGWHVYIKHVDSGTVTIETDGSETIDGVSGPWSSTVTNVSLMISKGTSASDWRVLVKNYKAAATANPSVTTPGITNSAASSVSATATNSSPWGLSAESEVNNLLTAVNAMVSLTSELKTDFNTLSGDVDTLASKISEVITNLENAELMAT